MRSGPIGHGAALDCLDRAYEERASMLFSLPTSLWWDPLRAESRFQALLQKMNFPVANAD